jgi:cell shape-determining protein MreD
VKVTDSQRRLVVIILSGWVLFMLARQINHLLAPWGMSLWLGGALVAFPALQLNFRTGLVSSLLLGAMVDVWSPLPFGTHALLFGLAHVIIFRIRARLAASEMSIGIIVTLITNLALFVALTFWTLGSAPVSGLRILSDLVLSQIVLGLITPWFFALQLRGMDLIFKPWRRRVRAGV